MIKPHTIERGIHRLKRVDLRMNEQLKYEVIKSLVDHNGNKKAAALKLGCTTRHINRLIQKYKQNGKATSTFFYRISKTGNLNSIQQQVL